jgi:hypothetical protein
MREWKEVGKLMLTDSNINLLVRANTYSPDGFQVRSIDVLLCPDDMYSLYTILKSKLEDIMNKRFCILCKHHGSYTCQHPNKEVRGYVCDREDRKYFEPKYKL